MRKRFIKFNKATRLLGLGGLMFGGVLCLGGQASAVAPVAPSVGFELGAAQSEHADPDKTQVLVSGLNGTTTDHYWVPLTIELHHSNEYSVTAQAATSGLKDLSNTNNTAEIASIDGASTLEQMSNQWGFRYKKGDSADDAFPSSDTTSYQSLASSVQIKDDTADANGFMNVPTGGRATWIFDFGAGVDGTMPSGHYGTNVTISVVATPNALPSFYAIEYMQDFTRDDCLSVDKPAGTTAISTTNDGSNVIGTSTGGTNTVVPRTVIKDKRDNKEYYIARLADGNCWMVQNLALDGGRTLKSTDSNVTSDWAMPANKTGNAGFQSNNQNMAEIYRGTHLNGRYNTQGYYGGACSDGSDKCSGTNSGNYYSWFAATAQGNGTSNGSNPSTGYANSATTSICPKNWKLPTSGDNNSQFQKLYDAYGNYTKFKAVWWPVNQSEYGGLLNTSTLYYTTSASHWWSGTVGSTSGSYNLLMNTSGIYPQYDGNRRAGFTVRCMLPV